MVEDEVNELDFLFQQAFPHTVFPLRVDTEFYENNDGRIEDAKNGYVSHESIVSVLNGLYALLYKAGRI